MGRRDGEGGGSLTLPLPMRGDHYNVVLLKGGPAKFYHVWKKSFAPPQERNNDRPLNYIFFLKSNKKPLASTRGFLLISHLIFCERRHSDFGVKCPPGTRIADDFGPPPLLPVKVWKINQLFRCILMFWASISYACQRTEQNRSQKWLWRLKVHIPEFEGLRMCYII